MARGLILFKMRILFTTLCFALPFAVLPLSASAQVKQVPPVIDLPAPEPLPVPSVPQADPRQQIKRAPSPETESETELEITADLSGEEIAPEDVVPESLAPDYSKLSPSAERAAKLDDLFINLAEKEDAQSANLVAEEIFAIWIDSGSASVNLLLRRGTEAEGRGQPKQARKMYNHAVDLSPNFAEAWSRSARLALTQKDYNRALNESLKTLELEPRHFFALWTMGNVFEVLGRQDEALEAYREANRLYPELEAVKKRLEQMETEVNGTVL